jgi:hypothetical protein
MNMKRFSKIVTVTCVAALALAAVSASGAQAAARFTASATGSLSGAQTNNQVFKTSATGSENVTCTTATTTGTIISTEATAQEVEVSYGSCSALIPGGSTVPATVSKAIYNLKANGEVEIKSTITITVKGGLISCTIVVAPQTPTGGVTYDSSAGKIEETSAVTGIVSSHTSVCPSGSTGTYSGNNLVQRVGGGTLAWDAV